MKRFILVLATLVTVLSGRPAVAAPSPCSAPVHHTFDFVLGSWIARHADGAIVGTATASSVLGGCAVRFDWTGRKYSGTSYNAYIEDDRHWQKSWFDNTGNLELLTGHAQAGVLTYEGTSYDKHISSGPIVTSEEWRMLADGRLRQRYRISVDARRTWRMLFTLYYTKVTV